MNTHKVKGEDHYQCREVKAERDTLKAELAALRERVEELEEVGGTKIAELEAENKELRSRLALDELLEERQEMEAENKAMELKLRAALRECDHCGALMPPATTLRGERL